MPRFADLSDNQLVEWMTNFMAVAVATPEKYGVTAAQLQEMRTNRNDLQAKMTARVAAEEAAKASVAAQKGSRGTNDDFCSYINKIVKADPNVTDADKIAVGVEPDKPPTRTPPVTPTDLVVNGYQDNRNALKWNRAGNKQNTQFIVEYLEAPETEFEYLATTTETTYEHKGAMPGKQCAYRVKAQRSGEESGYSNVAVVYMNG